MRQELLVAFQSGAVSRGDCLPEVLGVPVDDDCGAQVSGKQFDRPGLAALMDHARPGDSLAITRLDRIGRSLKELLETVENLKKQNIGLISLEERIDTTSAAGELIFHVFGAMGRLAVGPCPGPCDGQKDASDWLVHPSEAGKK